MDRQRSRWNQPAVVAPRSDRALPIEQRHTNDPFLPKSGAMIRYPQSFAAKPIARARRPLRRRALYDSGVLRRALTPFLIALMLVLVLAPAALAHDGGQGTFGVA